MNSSKGIGFRFVPRLVLLSAEEDPVEQLHSLEKELLLEGRKSGRLEVESLEENEAGDSGKSGESMVETENLDLGSFLKAGITGFDSISSAKSTSEGTSSGTSGDASLYFLSFGGGGGGYEGIENRFFPGSSVERG